MMFQMIVSIHAPTWGATYRNLFITILESFNPRAHVGRDSRSHILLLGCMCFNPRAHVGRDVSGEQLKNNQSVSIHAPTWGATWL